jgi:hypothetical protein
MIHIIADSNLKSSNREQNYRSSHRTFFRQAARHPVLKGFELTNILPFGGTLNPLMVDNDSSVIMTFIPEFPIYAPETAWMREPETNIPGLIDCYLYHQHRKLMLHLTNLTSAGTWRTPVHEYISVGPLTIKAKLTDDVKGEDLYLLVADKNLTAEVSEGWSTFTLNLILNYEVVILT